MPKQVRRTTAINRNTGGQIIRFKMVEIPMRDHLIAVIQSRFRTFGGGKKPSGFNPLENWLEDKPAQFAMGVDVGDVVDAILAELDS